MYFASRKQAGRMLASRLPEKYHYENCAVMALDDGGVQVGAQIAAQLHCGLIFLMTSEIMLPREETPLGGLTPGGNMVYNRSYSEGDIDEMVSEYRGLIEEEKITELHNLNRRIGNPINMDRLRRHHVIVVSDGLKTSFPFDLAVEFLKPVAIQKLVAATPLASVPVVDRMHVIADELYCLDVIPNYIDTNHYYDEPMDMNHTGAMNIVDNISLYWQR